MVFKKVKSTVLPILVSLLGAGLFAYALRLFFQDTSITDQGAVYQTLGLLVAAGLGLYLFATLFMENLIPLKRWVWPLVGIALIVFAQGGLQDDLTHAVYLRDIIKVIGVLLIFLGGTNSLVTEKRKQKVIDDATEIIEV